MTGFGLGCWNIWPFGSIAAAGYTQQQLQAKLRTSQPRVSDLLLGKISKFSLDTLVVYAELLGLRRGLQPAGSEAQALEQ
jgi:predicted XRE-type DNA-binding protein